MPVDKRESRAVEVELLCLLCRVLDGSGGAREAAAGLCGRVGDWDYFLRLAVDHRVVPLVARNVAALDVPVTPEIRAALQKRASGNALEAFRYLAEVRRLLALLQAAGIEARVLKGIPLSLQVFGEGSTRDVGDIDLLIEPSDAAEADRLLTADGFRRKDPMGKLTPRRWASYVWHFKDFTYEPLRGGGFEVDLHWRLFRNPFMPGQGIADCGVQVVTSGGIVMPTLPRMENLLYLAVQGAVDGWRRLRSLADVAALWGALSREEREEAGRLAGEMRIGAYVRAALEMAEFWIGGVFHEGVPVLEVWEARERRLVSFLVVHASAGFGRNRFLLELLPASSFALKRYEQAIAPGWRYKAEIYHRVLLRPRVWERFDLPDVLFPLYPLFSPVEWMLFHARGRSDAGRPA